MEFTWVGGITGHIEQECGCWRKDWGSSLNLVKDQCTRTIYESMVQYVWSWGYCAGVWVVKTRGCNDAIWGGVLCYYLSKEVN